MTTIEQAARVIRDAIGHFRASESMAEAAAQALSDAGLLAGGWRPISEAPHETLALLGWDEEGVWKHDLGVASAGERFANGYSNRWWHGSATHYMPLPSPPEEGR